MNRYKIETGSGMVFFADTDNGRAKQRANGNRLYILICLQWVEVSN